MPNIESLIKIMRSQKKNPEPESMYNCRIPENSLLKGKCLASAIVYESKVDAGTTHKTVYKYNGLTEGPFKPRFDKHNTSFKHAHKKNETELSKKIWELKEKNVPYKLSWKILKHGHPYRGGMRTCDLCLTEKVLILTSKDEHLLNKRSEILNKCRHTNKFMLEKYLN